MGLFGKDVHQASCGKCGWKGPKRDNEADMRQDVRNHSC